MFGIETLTDFLITLTVIQTAIIVFLVAMLLFRFNKSSNNNTSSEDKINNELSKKLSSLDTKISLISKEFSQAIKENAESITKLTTSVNTGSASTASALATANSSLDSLSNHYSLLSVFSNPTITSGLFEHNTDNHSAKPDYLKIESQYSTNETEDIDERCKEKMNTNIVQNIKESSHQKELEDITTVTASSQTHDKHSSSPYSLNIGARIRLMDQQHDHSVSNMASIKENYVVSQKSLDKKNESVDPSIMKQEHSKNENSSTFNDLAQMEPGTNNTLNQKSDQKYHDETLDSNQNKAGESNERNSNPEIDKLDIEILSALKRLGGIDEAGQNDDIEDMNPAN